jgi:hypothetical protein
LGLPELSNGAAQAAAHLKNIQSKDPVTINTGIASDLDGAATCTHSLILKRAPIGSNQDDYDALEDGVVVSRIFLSSGGILTGPKARPRRVIPDNSPG